MNMYDNLGHGGNGKIIINGDYKELNCDPNNNRYYGPVLHPKACIFNDSKVA